MNLKSLKKARLLRWGVLAVSTFFFLFFARIISVHAICPIGGFEMFFSGLFRSGFSQAGLFSAMVVIFLIMSILSVIFRRAYCGYICPLGALQELFMMIGKKILPARIRRLRLPHKLDKGLRYVKYVVLASFVVGAAIGAGHWMIAGDPFIVLIGLFSGGSIAESVGRNPSAFIFLMGILAFALFQGKGFCKYLCPAGAWYALLSKISPNRVKRDTHSCINCGLCSKSCSMDIDVAKMEVVTSAECIGCHECVNACPVKGALSAPLGKVYVKSAVIPFAAAAVFSGSLLFASAGQSGEHSHGEGGEKGFHQTQDTENSPDAVSLGVGGCPGCTGCGLCIAV